MTAVAEVDELLKKVPEAVIMSAAARISRSRARNKPKVMRPCGMCGEMFGAKELRDHLPRCPKWKAF
jgi:predicted Zn-ribbon and HTH transcriptional regulator